MLQPSDPIPPSPHLAGESIATQLFELFLDPAAHGVAFRWEEFPAMAERLVRSTLWMAYPAVPKGFHEMEIEAQRSACATAKRLMAEHVGPLPVRTVAPGPSPRAPRPA